MTPEGEVVKAVLEYLAVSGIHAWRNNTGAMTVPPQNGKRGRFIRFGTPGVSDILGILKDGRFLAIECKAGKGRPTEAQLEFLHTIRDFGGVAILAYSVDDVIDELGRAAA